MLTLRTTFIEIYFVVFRAFLVDSHCLQAQRYMILYMLCREGNYGEAAQKIADLVQEMDRTEPRNAYLYDEFAKIFCRLVSKLEHISLQIVHINCQYVNWLTVFLSTQSLKQE